MDNDKPILTISVAANLLKLHPRTLMLYERSGLITPYRTETQRRYYSKKDLEELQFIKYLTQNEGVNLKAVKLLKRAIKVSDKNGLNLRKILFPEFKPSPLV